jgi:hypothetical protein
MSTENTEASAPPAIDQLLATVKDQLTKMQNPNHPVFKLTVERVGFGFDNNRVPQVAEFIVKLEHVTTVAQLPTVGVSGLIIPDELRKSEPIDPIVQP